MHAHIIPSCVYAGSERDGHWHGNRIEQDDAGRDVLVARGRRPRVTPPSMRYTPSERAQALDAMNVDMHLLSLDPHLLDYEEAIDTALAGFREINDDMSAYARAQPDRFMGLATLPMQDGVAAAEELERAVTELGLKGMELCAGIRGGGLDDPAFDPVWAVAERLDAAIFVHPDPNAPIPLERMPFLFNLIGNPIQTTLAVYSVIFGGVLDRFPNLKFCFAHGGGLACYAMPRAEVHGYLPTAPGQTIDQSPAQRVPAADAATIPSRIPARTCSTSRSARESRTSSWAPISPSTPATPTRWHGSRMSNGLPTPNGRAS